MRFVRSALLSIFVAACAGHTPDPDAQPEVNARIGTPEAPIARGDCVEARRRAAANPALDVEKVAAPIAMIPPPIDVKKMPKSVPDKNGYYEVKFQVLVDTLGKPDMRTFSVIETTNPWLGTSVKAAVAKWKFSPAEVAGCKVPRNYSLGLSPRGKTPAKTTTKKPPID